MGEPADTQSSSARPPWHLFYEPTEEEASGSHEVSMYASVEENANLLEANQKYIKDIEEKDLNLAECNQLIEKQSKEVEHLKQLLKVAQGNEHGLKEKLVLMEAQPPPPLPTDLLQLFPDLTTESEATQVMKEFVSTFKSVIRFLNEFSTLRAQIRPLMDQYSTFLSPRIKSVKRLSEWIYEASDKDLARVGIDEREAAMQPINDFFSCQNAATRTLDALSHVENIVAQIKGHLRDGSVLWEDDLIPMIEQKLDDLDFQAKADPIANLLPILRLHILVPSDLKHCTSTSYKELMMLASEYNSMRQMNLPSAEDWQFLRKLYNNIFSL